VAEKKIDERAGLRCAEDETRGADRSGNIDNRFCRRRANGVTKKRLIISGLLFGCAEDRAGFGVFLPFASDVLLSHKRLFAHKKQIKTAAGFAGFAQGEVKRAAGA